ncbi:hypothetical protein DDB_G0281871 [Dictyostelium discoideum AX4]|uniref:TSET complex member tstB n=1 Tax=Dictyostelium discoideum TaxID=44689 RepID=TSTB_DICDI|nr:hypothetical protein DDB_G0281871 [Dictyostelium discoideum AX4]Q54TB8.1 RecName: Full=TSET complex member tstB; AltName: Full=Protein TSAUCER [Dictyostelium discoideum]EAL66495.1 hypothetical protein DDB_G0281871 [Dictyostelium discoideum AX4]|eukprot:XP_640471.1 hypothetical protein DDB_G0281871 [Dictyostelium discoideum AX4]
MSELSESGSYNSYNSLSAGSPLPLQEIFNGAETKCQSHYLQSRINTNYEQVKQQLKESAEKKNSSKIYSSLQHLTYYKVEKDLLETILRIIDITDDKKTLRLAYYFLGEISQFKHLINNSTEIKNITTIFNKEMQHKDISRKVVSLKTTASVAPNDVLIDANILDVISGILRKVGEDPDKTQKKKGFFTRATTDLGRERSLLQYSCFVACRNRYKNNPSLFMPIVEGIKCVDPVGARHAVSLTLNYALENPSTVAATTKRFIPLLKANKGKEAVYLVDPFARRNFIKLCGHLAATPSPIGNVITMENKDFFQSLCQSVMDAHLSVAFYAINVLSRFSWPTLESAHIDAIQFDSELPHFESLAFQTSLIVGICNKMRIGFNTYSIGAYSNYSMQHGHHHLHHYHQGGSGTVGGSVPSSSSSSSSSSNITTSALSSGSSSNSSLSSQQLLLVQQQQQQLLHQQSNPFLHLACKLISVLSQSYVKYSYPKDSTTQQPIIGDWSFDEKQYQHQSVYPYHHNLSPFTGLPNPISNNNNSSNNTKDQSTTTTTSTTSSSSNSIHPFSSLTQLILNLLNISPSISIRIQALKALVWLCPSNLDQSKLYLETFRSQLRDPYHPTHLFKELFLELYKRIIATPILSPMILELVYDWIDIIPSKCDTSLVCEIWKTIVEFGKVFANEKLLASIFKILDRIVHPDFRVLAMEIQKDIIKFLGEYSNQITFEQPSRFEQCKSRSGSNQQQHLSNMSLNSIIQRLQQYSIFSPWQIRLESIDSLAKIAFQSSTVVKVHIYNFLTLLPNESHGWTTVKSNTSIIVNTLDQLLTCRAKWLPLFKSSDLSQNQIKDLKNDHTNLCLQIGLFFDQLSFDYLPLGIESKKYLGSK